MQPRGRIILDMLQDAEGALGEVGIEIDRIISTEAPRDLDNKKIEKVYADITITCVPVDADVTSDEE